MWQFGKYLDFVHSNLDVYYPTIKKSNQVYLGVWNNTTVIYYAELMKTEIQTFYLFQKLIHQAMSKSRKKLKHSLIDFEREFVNKVLEKYAFEKYNLLLVTGIPVCYFLSKVII